MAAGSVKIGPEFFAGVFRDYADWRFALARELFQNSADADGTDLIEATINKEGDNTRLVWRNNGAPMTKDELVNKFLTLGASGKNCQEGKTGGFGAAKLLIGYCHLHYAIRTGTCYVAGAGADYDLQDCDENIHGTETSILIKGDEANNLINACKLLAFCAQWDGEFTLNGEHLATDLRKGSRRTEFEWGVVYTNKTMPGKLLLRVNGLPMAIKPISYQKGMVLIELVGASTSVLTSNRDGLVSKHQYQLDEFIAKIAVDTRSAFRDRKREIQREQHDGYLLAGYPVKSEDVKPEEIGHDFDYVLAARVAANVNAGNSSDSKETPITTASVRKLLHPRFHIYNEIGGVIPSWFKPGSFSDNSRRLASNWISLMVELAVLTKSTEPFAVGFCFSGEMEGAHERHDNQRVLYVNPATLVEKDGKPRQLKVRWKFDNSGNYRLLALACHEWIHFMGKSTHDEEYASEFTDLMAKVMENRTRFTRHFSSPCCWPK